MKASETLSFIINSIKKIHDKTENQNLKKAIKNKWSQIKTVSSDNYVRVNEYSDENSEGYSFTIPKDVDFNFKFLD